jgi:segregation and condensation protein B
MELMKLKQILEAALMASGEVLSVERMQLLFDDYDQPKSKVIIEALESLMADFSGRGIELVEVASGYRLQVRKEVAPWVTRLWDEKPPRYSRALLETLSLIAYRQPITRGDIEDVRGVAVSSNIIRTLLEREWVRVVGHRDVPGRPAMYATTKEFLDYFSLKSLDELPTLDEIREIDNANQGVDLINAEKKASVTREYDFASEDDVEARGEEVLSETEIELQEAERLMRQVEENVFNQPSEEELAVAREAERQANAEEERQSATEPSRSFADMANKTQQRLSGSLISDGPSIADLADKIADHQAKVKPEEQAEVQTEELTLVQQQERLMQQLMQEETERQKKLRSQPLDSESDLDLAQRPEPDSELLAEAQAEQELLEQQRLVEEQIENELIEKERLAEEALANELGLNESVNESTSESAEGSTQQNSFIKKDSLFDD